MQHSWRRIAGLPAVRMLALYSAGVLLQWYQPQHAFLLLTVTGAVSLLAAGCAVAALRWRSCAALRDGMLLPLLLLCGMLRTATVLESEPTSLLHFADRKEKLMLSGYVDGEARVSDDRQRFTFRCRRVETEDSAYVVDGRVMVSWRRSRYDAQDTLQTLRPGDLLHLRCRLRTPLAPRQSGGFDARSWLITEHCQLLCSVSKGRDLQITGYRSPGYHMEIVHDLRRGMREALASLYGQEQYAIMCGLLLGDRSSIGRERMSDFRRSGIMHILAVSGLHAGIVLMLFFIPTERLPYTWRALLAMGGMWTFAAVTGFAPPVTRASVMGTLALSAAMLQRRSDTVNALAAAGLLILLFDPLQLTGVSFQLSFTAVLGILMLHGRITRTITGWLPRRIARTPLAGKILALLALTLSAQALSLPILLHAFGEMSTAGLITNLIAVPLVFIVVSCGLLSVLAFPLSGWLAGSFAATAAFCLDTIMWVSSAIADIPFASVGFPSLPVSLLLAWPLMIIYLSFSQGRLRQKVVLLLLVSGAIWIAAGVHSDKQEGTLRLTFLDVGQGDAAVLELPSGRVILVDTGPGGDGGDAGSYSILPFLRSRGIAELDAMIITHPDDDHRGGAGSILRGLPVERVIIGGAWPDEGEAAELLALIKRTSDTLCDLRRGDSIALDPSVRMYVLSPPPGAHVAAGNDNSVVFMLQHGEKRFLFTGDAEAGAERQMVMHFDTLLQADVLKVGHHGSMTSSIPAFIHAVRPRHAVISAGRNNRFNHPRMEILTRLRTVGARISRTDVEGAVCFISDGKTVRKISATE
ncbi:DNA internalization-related competence protein ComEC/Rec2 [bacterium]|nr:DNA internalization-related competence protein ComEC/Rec2 [bacterium]